jgi:tRNA/tmRNA/rRNA uracil-C5-methylase (TrmA/RlmC/RlmD family)
MGICVHKDFCGGCIYQGILYEEQLRIKNNLVEKLLDQRDLYPVEHLGFQPAPQIYRYRNKMEYTFGDMVKGGPITLGLHQKGHFMNVVTVDECQLVDEDFNVILDAMLTFVEKKGYKSYNKKSHQGLLRHLVLRKGERTGELLIRSLPLKVLLMTRDFWIYY